MAKLRRIPTDNNRRMTDFFTHLPPSSSQKSHPPPSSSCSTLRSTSQHRTETASDLKKTTLKETRPVPQSPSKMGVKPQSSHSRVDKKENAPPPRPTRLRAASEREVVCISSSSEAPTHITISSNSAMSFDSSIVEVVPPVKQDRRHLQTIDVASPRPQPRRRSPRLKSPKFPPKSRTQPIVPSVLRKRSPKKRKKPEGVQSDDGDVIELDAMEEVIYVSSKPAKLATIDPVGPSPAPARMPGPSSSRKRSHVNDLPPLNSSSDVVEVIPSSQSDEQELSMPKRQRKNLTDVMEGVREWQLSSSQSTTPLESSEHPKTSFDDPGMDFGFEYPYSSPRSPITRNRTKTPPKYLSPRNSPALGLPNSIQVGTGSNSPSPVLVSSASSITKVDTPTRISLSKKPKQTPSGRLSRDEPGSPSSCMAHISSDNIEIEMGSEVVLLDQNEKTDGIVERIKAEARAKAMAMPDEDSMILGSLDDSDSGLDSPPCLFTQVAKGKEPTRVARKTCIPAQGNTALTDRIESPLTDFGDSYGWSTRRRSNIRHVRVSPSPPSLASAVMRTRKAATMLPSVIFDVARASSNKSVNPLSKLLIEKARQDRFTEIRRNPGVGIDVDLSDAADEGTPEGFSSSESQFLRQGSDEGDTENVVGEADRVRLFGERDNGVLGKILESDRREKGKGMAMVDVLGVPFWETRTEEDFSVTDIPSLENSSEGLSFELLKGLQDAGDVSETVVLLQSSMFAIRNTRFVEWLFEVAICTSENLAIAAFTLLGQICSTSADRQHDIVVPISPVLKMLPRFGARQDVLEAIQLEARLLNGPAFTSVQRFGALWRLSELVRMFGAGAMLDGGDVPSYFALLLSIGMDSTTNLELRLSIRHALNTLIRVYCGEFSDERREMEKNICSKALCLSNDLSPTNKVHLLSFIEGDSLVARRIGQWIAFSMLAGNYGARLARESVDGPPPLSDVLALLEPRSDSELRSDLFIISRKPSAEEADSFDYAALGHHVEVLGCVLMNIPKYVLLEKVEAREAFRKSSSLDASANESFSKRRNETSKLEIIKGLLSRLGNGIADTRAAHLDRSHTKAVIQQLAMRIHYQRRNVIERPKIDKYFSAKST